MLYTISDLMIMSDLQKVACRASSDAAGQHAFMLTTYDVRVYTRPEAL